MKTKKIISLLLSILLTITALPMISINSNAATNHTLSEAVDWIKARGNENWWQDVDGAYGCQCVDLIKAYYQYLVGYSVSGNAKDYLQTSKLPSGWWMDSTPAEGAIIVWGGNTWTGQWTTGANGHVGLVYSVSGSNVYTVETNTGGTNGQGNAAAAKFRTRVNCNAKYIHPDFSATQTPSISYSSITPGEYYIENGNGMILTTDSNNTSSGTIVGVWDFIAHPGFRVNISGSSEAYKLRFSNCADNIAINAYSDSPKDGTTVNIREYTNNSTQWWRFESVGNGYYAIRNAYNPSVCLTLNPNSSNHGIVTLQTYVGSVYQKWALRPYSTGTVVYNANGGSGAPASQIKHYRENLTLSSVKPNRTGYTFAGWATSPSAVAATYAAGGIYSNESSVELYAVWQKNPVTVSSISIQSKPTKTVYTVGEKFDTSGLTVKVTMSDGTTKTITNGFMLSNPDMSTAGTKTVTVSYSGKTASFTITVNNPPAVVSSISIQSKPTKTVYTVGENFDTSGLTVKVTMSDGTTKTITSGFTVSNPDMSTAGTKTVTVSYSGKAASFTITVKTVEPPVNTGTLRLITPASARIGQTVQIPVQLDKASLGTLSFTVTYDRTKLKYVSCTESAFDMCDAYAGTKGVIKLACIDNTEVSAGKIAVLTFEVIAPAACLTDLTVTVEEAYDGSDKAVSIAGGTWNLSVVKTLLGDVNGDGKVTAIDARWALQAASGARTLTEEQKAAADANGDGKITAIDARWILQAASGSRVL